jgi:F0F1-type ATP synthase assembly protein I
LQNSNNDKKNPYYMAGIGMSLCLELAVSVGVGWWLGEKLDAKLHSSPWFMIVGIAAFFSVSLYHMIVVLGKK